MLSTLKSSIPATEWLSQNLHCIKMQMHFLSLYGEVRVFAHITVCLDNSRVLMGLKAFTFKQM